MCEEFIIVPHKEQLLNKLGFIVAVAIVRENRWNSVILNLRLFLNYIEFFTYNKMHTF